MITTFTPKRRVAVRWPFRIMAALLLALIVLGAGLTFWLWYAERSFGPHEQLLLHLPLILFASRLLFYAVTRASVPPDAGAWPFATDRLLGAYLLCLMVFDYIL